MAEVDDRYGQRGEPILRIGSFRFQYHILSLEVPRCSSVPWKAWSDGGVFCLATVPLLLQSCSCHPFYRNPSDDNRKAWRQDKPEWKRW